MKRVPAFTAMLCATISITTAHADETCVDLIKASRNISSIIESQNKTEEWARAFCTEYFASGTSSRSQEFGAAYSGLSASFGSTRASEQTVASKYCDASSSNKVQNDLYRRYFDVIAPGAFEAYNNCIENQTHGLKYSVGEVTAWRLPIFIDYDPPQANAPIVLDFSADGAISCKWNPRGTVNSLSLVEPSTVTLTPSDGVTTLFSSNPQVLKLKKGQAKLICDRSDTTKPVSVEIISADANYKPLSFKWVEYQGNVPAPTIAAINEEMKAFLGSINGAVVGFNAKQCPDGWQPYDKAYGRFLRGIDPDGKVDPDGVREPGTTQEDELKRHRHPVPYDDVPAGRPGAGPGAHYGAYTHASEDIRGLTERGGDETRPKNVAVLYCVRN